MSPRPGGESDKLGNDYEGAWIVRQILEVLAGGAESITVEELGEIGEGVEFTVRRRTAIEVHQVKRQRGSANYWNLGDLRAEGVLESARRHVAEGRQFHFVSTIPARTLEDLAELARHSPDVQTFDDNLKGESKENFERLIAKDYASAQVAWDTLRGTFSHWPGEWDLRSGNAALAGLLVTGAPGPAAAVTLADLANVGLSNTLDKQAISELLANYELALAAPGIHQSVARAVGTMHTSWKESVERELLEPEIHRLEADEIVTQLAGEDRVVFAIGAGGSGKSAVLHGVVEQAEGQGWSVLACRLDREEPFSSTYELGHRRGLEMSPVSALALVAADRPSLLVIDQLDAVSKASGRLPLTFHAVADLVREASAFPQMRVLLACRKFDHDNDDRIRTLIQDHQAKQVLVADLSDEQVTSALGALGVPSDRLTRQQRELMRIPLHLKLLATIATQAETFSFTTTKELFDAYWDQKRRDCGARRGGSVRFADVLSALADEMSARQRLEVPVSVLDDSLQDDADVLASENVLVRDGRKVAFFHETFFDYAFARHWTRRGQTLVQFLLTGEQELFVRAQVRQILTYIREEDAGRFIAEMESLLAEPQVRFHVKHVALGLLGALQDPSIAERQLVEHLFERDLYPDQLANALRSVPWFDRLDADGVLAAWLSSDDEKVQSRVLKVVPGVARERPDQLAALLAPHAQQAERYPDWLRWVARFADIHESRPLFELVVAAVLRGEYNGHERELFMSVYNLGKARPQWAVELLVAHLDRPAALTLDASGHVLALKNRDHAEVELVTAAAAGAPAEFCQALVPYVLKVLALTSHDERDGRFVGAHFGFRHLGPPYHEVEQALTAALVGALRAFVQSQPEVARPLLEQLAADPHEPAQWLLYEGLGAGGGAYGDYALELLFRDNGLDATETWTVRRLIEAISPHLDDESFGRLEQAIVYVRPRWEQGPSSGVTSFTLLSAMEEIRLSETGRRRLGELRRRFGADQPTEQDRVTGGFMGPPIPQESAQRMNDDNWLRAMAKHNADREDWTSFRGGAHELAQVLKEEVKKDPGRFARLALRIRPDTHAAYTQQILIGLGEATAEVDPNLVFQAVRHIASLGNEANDRWLGYSLRQHLKADVPDDLIRTLAERAVNSADPEGDSATEELGDDGDDRDRLLENGINTARGELAEALGNLLMYDTDGHRTSLALPSLNRLAADPSLTVRACTAHLVAACLRHASPQAIEAFHLLVAADDRLLGSRHVENLILYVGNGDVEIVKPVIQRMLSSTDARAQQAGGRLAAYAGLELTTEELLATARASSESAVRRGVAEVCAGRLPHTANAAAAGDVICQLANDADEKVRDAVSGVAAVLRGRPLQPFRQEILTLIASPAFQPALSQLLITLEHAPDRVDDLILACARRYVDVYGAVVNDFSTAAAGEAREVGELLLRAYGQAAEAEARRPVLDLLDSLLASDAYGVSELVEGTDR